MAILGDTSATSLQVLGTTEVTGSVTGAGVKNNTAAGAVGWNSGGATHADNLKLINVNTLSYWNGAYTSTTSNLAYCNKGAFGTIVTKGTGDYLASTTKYAASGSVGGSASSLANFKVTTTSNNAIDTPGSNAVAYASGLTKAAWNYQQVDGGYYCQWYSASWFHQIFGDYRTGQISVRGNNNGTKTAWRRVLDESNYSTIMPAATTSAVGLMSAADKTKLDGIATGANAYTHPNTVTAGTVGTSSATSGSTLAVPYVTYNANGHITATGTHTHTISGFLTAHQTIKQDAITGATANRFGTCSTAAATAAKTVSVTAGTPALEAGLRVTVKFSNANTAGTPTLNVNSLGAKNIFHKGVQITTGDNKALLAGTCDFVYDGTQFHLVGNYIDTNSNTTYSAGTGLSLSSTTFNHSNSITAGTAGTSSATSGSTLAVPYVTYDAQGHITATGTHTHTVSGFLTSHQTIKQDAVTGATANRFGTCSTAAGTAAKTVSVTAGTPTLEAGLRVTVKFSNANTAGTPTLNVNSLGAKNIFHKGAQITTGDNKALLAGTCDFVYDGTQFHLIGNYIDTVYTHPTDAGNKHIPSGGSSNQVLVYSAAGTAAWGAVPTHSHSNYLTAHQTIKQDAVTGATANRFGTCGTAAATAAKTVSVTAGTPTLEAGLRVTVKFTYANTAGTPTLNVNSLGAKNIFHKGAQITTGDNKALLAGTCDFVYDGTQFHLVGNYIDTNTTYSANNGVSLSGTTFSNSGVRSIAASSTNGKISVNTNGTSADVTAYTHPTTAGNKHIPTGGSTGQVLIYGGSSGTASWGTVTAGATLKIYS